MATRKTYDEADKAKVYVVLQANEGNAKRTAREVGIPYSTVRLWRNEFAANGPPKVEAVEEAAKDFIAEAEKTRDFAMETLQKKIPDATPSALIAIIGVLDDKIVRARGLDKGQRVDVHHHLPSHDEARQLMSGFFKASLESAQSREDEIIDAEIVEPAALPAASIN